QHLPDEVGHERHREMPGVFSEHEVGVLDGTRLGSVVGARTSVKSHHHQGFGRLGDGLREAARDDDGTLEAVEDPSRRFALGVLWNFPLAISSWKLGPALACGNTVVLKPAELTPLTALRLGELALDAGLPEGVLNVVVGAGSTVGQRLAEHPDVAKIGFTGSTEVGRSVMAGAAATIKRVTLELGGKSANVVFADADLERAAALAPAAAFGNAGQDCCS